MNRFFSTLAIAAVAVAVTPTAYADHKGKIPWVENLPEALADAKVTGKPLMLFFSADW